jgi:sirohydrochlorin ferrochelatase
VITVTANTVVPVSLYGDCASDGCLALADRMRDQLDIPKYRAGVSLMAVPDSLEEWRSEHRTARKRADRSRRLGYRFAEIDRSHYAGDIYEINTSLSRRQGRPMEAGYRDPCTTRLPNYPCDRHNVRTYGVLEDDRLRAYLYLYRLEQLVLVSMILGHGSHLRNDIMYLLFAGVVADQAGQGGWFYYNRHDSGTDGLVYYKERQGFRSEAVEWVR